MKGKETKEKELSIEERLDLIKSVANGGEIVGEEELIEMLKSGKKNCCLRWV